MSADPARVEIACHELESITSVIRTPVVTRDPLRDGRRIIRAVTNRKRSK